VTDTDLAPFHAPGTPEYAEACASFQLAGPVDPAGAFVARTVEDVVRAVGTARRAGLPLRINTTGHAMGRTAPVAGSLLVRPQLDAPVRIDVAARTARIPAGKRWADVLAAATPHGLTAVHGSSATVGVIGYLLNGGISFYGRRHGIAANLVRSLTVVGADGEVTVAGPELLWALRGGGGGFGIVVEAEIELIPVHRVVTGMTVWDARDAARVAPAWQRWTATAPAEVTTSLRLLNVPPLPSVPPQLAGRHVLAIDGAVAAVTEDDVATAERIAADLVSGLSAIAEPIMTTWATAGPELLPATHMDPAEPIPFRSDTALLGELDDEGWTGLLAAAGVGESTSLLSVELRQLGGAFAEPGPRGGAFSHIPAPLLYWACGIAGVPGTEKDLARVRDALAPYRTGFTAPTFTDHFDQEQRTYDEQTRARVERARAAADPHGLFAGDVAVIRDASGVR
jgi:hypothetical protein